MRRLQSAFECVFGALVIALIAGPFVVGSLARFFWLACEMGWHRAEDWAERMRSCLRRKLG